MKIVFNRDKSLKNYFKRGVSYLYAYTPMAYILVGFHSLFSKKREYKHEMSLCLIFKDEAPYLKEWIDYHSLIGVDHFYLYNNNSSDNFVEVLRPYINRGVVTCINWELDYGQIQAYNHCYSNYNDESHWIGFIDIDEFINISVETGSNIKQLLKRYSSYPSLYVFWRIFGTSGIMKEDYSRPVIEQFTSCWPFLCNTGKGFINNDWKFKKIWIHWQKAYYMGFPIYPVIDNYVFNRDGLVKPIGKYKPKLYLNHYWSRSREFSIYKVFHRTDALNKNQEDIRKKEGVDSYELKCSTKDFSIQRWLVLLKEKMSVKNDA